MKRPIRLGLIFSYREDWIGGSYYLLNLMSALKRLDDSSRPEVMVFGVSEADIAPVRALDYPGASFRILHEPQPGFMLRLGNRVSAKIFGRLLIQPPAIEESLDVVYPAAVHPRYRKIPHRLFWIPDFQEEYLPDMFGQKRVENRRTVRSRVARSARHIVFSSQDAARDFRRFYPDSSADAHVLNFAVTHPYYEAIDIQALREKFALGAAPFFMVSNQFWRHKNHPLVIEAMKHLVDSSRDKEFLVCFSGKEEDVRNPDYPREVRAMVTDYNLKDRIRFLGFIDRAEQLALMKESVAVIQPSLFEGWSTVIEDAKALSVTVLASDLPVHLEQLGEQGVYFPRKDSLMLAEKMQEQLEKVDDAPSDPWAYEQRVEAFGRHFVNILKRVVAHPED